MRLMDSNVDVKSKCKKKFPQLFSLKFSYMDELSIKQPQRWISAKNVFRFCWPMSDIFPNYF